MAVEHFLVPEQFRAAPNEHFAPRGQTRETLFEYFVAPGQARGQFEPSAGGTELPLRTGSAAIPISWFELQGLRSGSSSHFERFSEAEQASRVSFACPGAAERARAAIFSRFLVSVQVFFFL